MTSSIKSKQRKVIVDPSFALEWRDIDDFLNEFGPYNGRYIPSYPVDWSSRLKAHVEELDLLPRKKQEMVTKIWQLARLCTVPENWEWLHSKTWKQNLSDAHKLINQSIVVGDAFDPAPFESWQAAIDDIRSSRARSWIFKGSISNYIDLCRPLLLSSPAAYLIDPYLNPLSEDIEFLLRAFLEKIKGSRCYSIEIITRWPIEDPNTTILTSKYLSTQDFDKKLRGIYQNVVPKKCTLKIHAVKEGKGDGHLRMHDRFFMTNFGAINFGHGFRIDGNSDSLQNAFVVDRDHHALLKKTYVEGVAYFRKNDSSTIVRPIPQDVLTFTVQG